VQAAIACVGLPLGLVAFLLDAPSLWAPHAAYAVFTVLTLATAAVAEEIVFRGILQNALGRIAGGGVAIATVLSVAPYVGIGWSLIPAAVAAAIFAVSVARTRTLLGVSAGHVALAVGASVVWPAIFGAGASVIELAVAFEACAAVALVPLVAILLRQPR
jgi:membrane protease YdiL (CAAX protease family)